MNMGLDTAGASCSVCYDQAYDGPEHFMESKPRVAIHSSPKNIFTVQTPHKLVKEDIKKWDLFLYKQLTENKVDSKSWSVCPSVQNELLTSVFMEYLRLHSAGSEVTQATVGTSAVKVPKKVTADTH